MRVPCNRWPPTGLPGHGYSPRYGDGTLIRFRRQMPVSWASGGSSHRHLHTNPVSARYMVNSQDASPIEYNAFVDAPRTTSGYQERVRGKDAAKETGSNIGKIPCRSLRQMRGGTPDISCNRSRALEEFQPKLSPRRNASPPDRSSSLDHLPSYMKALERPTKKTVQALKEKQRLYLAREREHLTAEGVSTQLSLYILLDAESELNAAMVLQPLVQQQLFIASLYDILKTYRHKHKQLYGIGWSVRFLARELANDLRILGLIQRAKFTPYREGIRRYNIIILKSSVASAALATNLELHHSLGQISHCHNIRALNLRPYMSKLREIALTMIDLQSELYNIRLRRDKSDKRQTIFNAFYHRWGSIVKNARMDTKDMRVTIAHHQKTCSGWSDKKREEAREALDNIYTTWERLDLIYRRYLPIYMRRLDLMSASELDQNLLVAERFWFTYCQTRRQNEQRMEELDNNLATIQKAKNKSRREQRRRIAPWSRLGGYRISEGPMRSR
ncbi:hypothetical protein P3342_008987 [Pyrenophora teres f. teres]|nr:hypothetical protein P3342_008987 [Pyrenophora teres f. teres]